MASTDAIGEVIAKLIKLGIKVLVFDFDLTLTRFHVWSRFRDDVVRVAQEARIEDFVDGDGFKTLVGAARDADISVYIATYGNYKVVRHYMGLLWRDSPCPFERVNIITPGFFEGIDGFCDGYRDGREMPVSKDMEVTEKNRQLAHIRETRDFSKGEMMLFDDTTKNVENAKAVGYEHSFLVDKAIGLGLVEFCKFVDC